MGGTGTVRAFLKGGADLVDSLPSSLGDLVRVNHPGVSVEIVYEPCPRSDLFLQQMEGSPFPEELREQGLDGVPFVAAQFLEPRFPQELDVVVLSIEPEVSQVLWKHRERGYLFCPPPGWEGEWSSGRKLWLEETFCPLGRIEVEQFKENFTTLIRTVKRRWSAHVIVYNGSTFDPEDRTCNYRDIQETVALRIHKLNRALMEISVLEGISIVDVDRLIAELGAERHVVGALRYSAEGHRTICKEFLRILEEIGFFENRPLVMQVGHREN